MAFTTEFLLGIKIKMRCSIISSICQQYQTIDAKRAIRAIINGCVVCCWTSPTIPEHLMGDLPRHRITNIRPFLIVGVDYCRPLFLKEKRHRNCAKIKTFVAVFVCFSTRAVHLEIVDDLTTEACMASLKCFFARQGKSSHLYSDKREEFRRCRLRTAQTLGSYENFYKALWQYQNEPDIIWHFTPPKSPHFGGLWEAAEKAFKRHFVQ